MDVKQPKDLQTPQEQVIDQQHAKEPTLALKNSKEPTLDRKRKIRDEDESAPDGDIMSLLKRLHLDRSSELYEKCLPEKCPPVNCLPLEKFPPEKCCSPTKNFVTGGKRWRLSPILEHGNETTDSVSRVKRRRIDSEMAEKMTNALWITEASEKLDELNCGDDVIDVSARDVINPCNDVSDSKTDDIPSLDNVRHVQLNVTAPLSLEDHVLQREFQAQSMQLVLWTPPPLDIAAITEAEGIKCYDDNDDASQLMC